MDNKPLEGDARAYIADEHHVSASDRDRAVATHLRMLAAKLETQAKRHLLGDDIDSLSGSDFMIDELEDMAVREAVASYINKYHRKLGDLSLAHDVVKLVRAGSQVWRA